jgi:hypothetical protein
VPISAAWRKRWTKHPSPFRYRIFGPRALTSSSGAPLGNLLNEPLIAQKSLIHRLAVTLVVTRAVPRFLDFNLEPIRQTFRAGFERGTLNGLPLLPRHNRELDCSQVGV